MHPRDQIVQTVAALLVAANTNALTRVDTQRIDARKKTQIPAISVYWRNDVRNDSATSEMEEGYDLVVEIVGQADPAAINDLMQQIESAVRADRYFGGLVSDSNVVRTPLDIGAVNGHSDPVVAFSALNVLVRYHIALDAT